MHVGILYSRIRRDEKLLLRELRDRGHEVTKIDVRTETFGLSDPPAAFADVDLVLDRCLSTSRSKYTTRFAASYGLPVVNGPETTAVCADKAQNSLVLAEAGVPTPRTEVSFTKESALEAIERFGYPCVLKPVVGSWGRLMAKIDSRSAAEAILEHKETLGHYEHKVFYIQEFVDKPGRDIRVLAVDGEPVAAMARSSDHWLTNAAQGASTESIDVDDEMADLVARASDAVGGGLLGVDLMETGDAYTVHEVNHTVEFKALNEVSEVDVPKAVVDWLADTAADAETAGVGGGISEVKGRASESEVKGRASESEVKGRASESEVKGRAGESDEPAAGGESGSGSGGGAGSGSGGGAGSGGGSGGESGDVAGTGSG